MRIGCGTLFGSFLVLVGVSVIAREVFHVDVPVVRLGLAVGLIWFGVSILAGSVGVKVPSFTNTSDTVLFSSGDLDASGQRELNVVFGSGVIDLSHVPAASPPTVVTVNAVFSDATVRYDPAVPMRVTATSAFGRAALPNEGAVVFGERTWESPGFDPRGRGITVHATAVFGNLRFSPVGMELSGLAHPTP